MSQHDDHANLLVERPDVGGDTPQRRPVQRAGTRWHVQPIGAGFCTRGRRTLTDRVDRHEADAYTVAFHDHRAAGLRKIAARSNGVDLGLGEAGQRLAQRSVAVVTDMVVSQGEQVEPGCS